MWSRICRASFGANLIKYTQHCIGDPPKQRYLYFAGTMST